MLYTDSQGGSHAILSRHCKSGRVESGRPMGHRRRRDHESHAMLAEGRKLAKIHKNVVVKVPLTRDGIRACSQLSREGTRVNVTLCFSAAQAILAAKAGAYFVSPFVGRVDDTGWDGMQLIRDIAQIYNCL